MDPTVNVEKLHMTALHWMTSFDHVVVKRMGHVDNLNCMYAFAWNVGEPGPTPDYFLMEREDGDLLVFKNPPTPDKFHKNSGEQYVRELLAAMEIQP